MYLRILLLARRTAENLRPFRSKEMSLYTPLFWSYNYDIPNDQ